MPFHDSQPPVTRRQLLGSGLLAVVGLAGCSLPATRATATTSKTVDIGAATALTVETENGDVSIEQGDGDTIDAEITKRTSGDEATLERIRVVDERDGGMLTVRVDRSDVPERLAVSVDLELTVPPSLAVERVTTTNGRISAAGVTGDGTYHTENGDIELEDVDGHLALHSTNGDVTAHEVAGVEEATTTNGDVDLSFTALRTDASATSTNGDVRLSVPADLNAAVELRTTNGEVTVEGLSLSNQSSGSGSITGTLNDGSHELTARTTNGDVTLLALR